MNKLIILTALLMTITSSFAKGRGILCDREEGVVQGCEQYLVHYTETSGSFPHVKVSDYHNSRTCSLLGYVDTKETESLSAVIQFLDEKSDNLPQEISLEGESSSSNGFSLPTKTLIKLQIDMSTGNGKLKYRSGKGVFNIITGNYMFPSENDPARDEILANCKEINL